MIDDRTVNAILSLCRFTLTEKEQEHFTGQIDEILSYVGMLESVDTAGIDPDLGKTQSPSQFREDEIRPGFPESQLERLSPWFENGHFIVPQIIEELDEKELGNSR